MLEVSTLSMAKDGVPEMDTVLSAMLSFSTVSMTRESGSTVAEFVSEPRTDGVVGIATVKLPPGSIVTFAPIAEQEITPAVIEQSILAEFVMPAKFSTANAP